MALSSATPTTKERNQTSAQAAPDSSRATRRRADVAPRETEASQAQPTAEAAEAPAEESVQSLATEASQSNQDYPLRVAELAYARYQSRGGEDGHDVEDWLEAEREVRGAQGAEHDA